MSDERRIKRLNRFRELASDRMERIGLLWLELEQGSQEAMAALLRDLHTHKGDASISGFAAVASLTHALEDAVAAMFQGGVPQAEDGDLYFEAVDVLSSIVDLDPSAESPEAQTMLAKLKARAAALSESATSAPPTPTPPAQPLSDATELSPTSLASGSFELPPPSTASGSHAVMANKSAAARGTSLRVESKQLDRMREIMGELMLARGRLDGSASRVRKERESAQRDRGSVADAELANRLERSLGGLESGLRDDVVHLSNLVDALHELTSDLRMIPIAELFDRYPRHLRELGKTLGKKVNVQVSGQDARLDREILDALEQPMLHLVRNAIDHGIESPEERLKAGKSETGFISLSTNLRGNSLEICVADDGGGIDVESVRRTARAKGLPIADDADDVTVLQCLLAPGMTTRSTLSEVSGRGIGLDVVDATVRALDGKLEIQSELGKGSRFTVSVPLSAAISMILTFRVGRGMYALPANSIETIEQEQDQVFVDSIEGKAIRFREQTALVIDLKERLKETGGATASMRPRLMIVRDGLRWLALAGADQHMQREAVLKPAGSLLNSGGLVTSGCPLELGSVALMLNVSALRSQGSVSALDVKTTQHIALVVDDSPIIRDLLAETLQSFGIEVIVANDGADALQKLELHGRADILVTDLDMPNISGVELIKAIRRRPGPRMPAIVVSTRGSKADQLAAINAGADSYLVKTSFTRQGLWDLVSKHLKA